jgi:uncharacterized protein YcfJ
MNKSTVIGIVIGAGVATAIGAVASYSVLSDDAEVDRTQASVPTDTQDCYEVEVPVASTPGDEKRIAGTVIGAVVGGAVGNDVGDSDLTQAAGAAAGAFAGNQAQKKFQENRTETTTEVRCSPE